jgi:hypothetical protein
MRYPVWTFHAFAGVRLGRTRLIDNLPTRLSTAKFTRFPRSHAGMRPGEGRVKGVASVTLMTRPAGLRSLERALPPAVR